MKDLSCLSVNDFCCSTSEGIRFMSQSKLRRYWLSSEPTTNLHTSDRTNESDLRGPARFNDTQIFFCQSFCVAAVGEKTETLKMFRKSQGAAHFFRFVLKFSSLTELKLQMFIFKLQRDLMVRQKLKKHNMNIVLCIFLNFSCWTHLSFKSWINRFAINVII